MNLIQKLAERWQGIDAPFLIHPSGAIKFADLAASPLPDLSQVKAGDVVALIGDFDPLSIHTLLRLIDLNAIVVPLTRETSAQHEYFFSQAQVDIVICGTQLRFISHADQHPLIAHLRAQQRPGLVLFSTGTTGQPKAILHDFTLFLDRFELPRPSLTTLNFLLFDHIGGLNTLFHALFNRGQIIAPSSRSVEAILALCQQYQVEVLPTTPTFLRMMLLSGLLPEKLPSSIKVISYGAERMDQPTLTALCELLPAVDFRQTFGMSEVGILRIKSQARDSLFIKIGGEGIETRVVDQMLEIRSQNRMLGYLNAADPFDEQGWYKTQDLVEQQGDYYKVIGRAVEVINVGGLKFMASDIEKIALSFEGVELAKAQGVNNPISGQHVELRVQPVAHIAFDLPHFSAFLAQHLPDHMRPRRIKVGGISVGHRFKRG